MLKRIYANNYKCLVNFELKLNDIALLLGENGSGKTTVFEILRIIQKFILGDPTQNGKYFQVTELFDKSSLTRWQNLLIQRFELDIEGDGGIYQYSLEIEHQEHFNTPKMRSEKLKCDNQILFEFWTQENENNHSATTQANVYYEAPNQDKVFFQFFDPSRSGVDFVEQGRYNQKISQFKKYISNLFIVRINPQMMKAENRTTDKLPNWDLSNYSAWYSSLSQENQRKIIDLTLQLKKIIKGFDSFQNSPSGELRNLLVLFTRPANMAYKLHELSDGQKMLIALYTMLYCTPDENATICIDEPENFLALPEIQPWLNELVDCCVDRAKQAILISHHPLLINYLAGNSGYWFDRQDNEATRVKPIQEEEQGGISIANLIELGWIYDE